MPKPESFLRPVRAHLGQMSRLLRFADQMDLKRRSEQAEGMRRSAAKHWHDAMAQYERLPLEIQRLLSADEQTSLRSRVPLPHSKRNLVIKQFVDREVLVPDAECAAVLRVLEQKEQQCRNQLAENESLTRRQRQQLEQQLVEYDVMRRELESRAHLCETNLQNQQHSLEEYKRMHNPEALTELEDRFMSMQTEGQRRMHQQQMEHEQKVMNLEDRFVDLEQANSQLQNVLTHVLEEFVSTDPDQQTAYLRQFR